MFYQKQSPLCQSVRVLALLVPCKQTVQSIIICFFIVMCMLVLLASSAHAQTTHRVQVGETLGSIAAKYGTTVNALTRQNGISNPNHIYVGQALTISGVAASKGPYQIKTYVPAPARTRGHIAPSGGCRRAARSGERLYYVRSGDTLSRIASRFGVGLSSLRNTNALWSDRIRIGQCLIIPSGIRATPAPVRPSTRPVVTADVTPVPLKVSTTDQ